MDLHLLFCDVRHYDMLDIMTRFDIVIIETCCVKCVE